METCAVHDHASAHKSKVLCGAHNVQVPLSLVCALTYGHGNILLCAVHDHASAHKPKVLCGAHNVQVPLSLVCVLTYGQGNILLCTVHDHASAHKLKVLYVLYIMCRCHFHWYVCLRMVKETFYYALCMTMLLHTS
jgi:hypothetical protein